MLDWCFQRAIGVTHLSIFMKYLSEKCQEDSVSEMYGIRQSSGKNLRVLVNTKNLMIVDIMCAVICSRL
ncbi:hypothetical protein BVRB_1g021510 [Beta vulgaris subsp. vulgaris]|nr:hypothetical protein BVRB_1g021510 [Beta vulgaris subsp. vulgaris]